MVVAQHGLPVFGTPRARPWSKRPRGNVPRGLVASGSRSRASVSDRLRGEAGRERVRQEGCGVSRLWGGTVTPFSRAKVCRGVWLCVVGRMQGEHVSRSTRVSRGKERPRRARQRREKRRATTTAAQRRRRRSSSSESGESWGRRAPQYGPKRLALPDTALLPPTPGT